MTTTLLLDATCQNCEYEDHNLALGANSDFLLERPDGWLSVVTACPSCQKLVDIPLRHKDFADADGEPDLVCPDCETRLEQPNQAYPELTLTSIAEKDTTIIEEQRCPRCGQETMTIRIVGTFS